jgi:hypothetical protein
MRHDLYDNNQKISETSVFLENNRIEENKNIHITNPVYKEYLLGYSLISPFVFLFFTMYILDFYFINKVIVIRNLENIMIHMPLWLIIDGVVGVSFFLFGSVYHMFHFYEELYNKSIFRGFYITFLVYSLFIISWTVIGWLLFQRYPTLPSTRLNVFHIKMWTHLILQSFVSLFLFLRSIFVLKNY